MHFHTCRFTVVSHIIFYIYSYINKFCEKNISNILATSHGIKMAAEQFAKCPSLKKDPPWPGTSQGCRPGPQDSLYTSCPLARLSCTFPPCFHQNVPPTKPLCPRSSSFHTGNFLANLFLFWANRTLFLQLCWWAMPDLSLLYLLASVFSFKTPLLRL